MDINVDLGSALFTARAGHDDASTIDSTLGPMADGACIAWRESEIAARDRDIDCGVSTSPA
jgi:hypothetical protein